MKKSLDRTRYRLIVYDRLLPSDAASHTEEEPPRGDEAKEPGKDEDLKNRYEKPNE